MHQSICGNAFFKNEISKNLRRCDGFKSLLTGGVPQLSLDSAPWFEMHGFCSEFDSNGGVFVFRQLIFDVSAEQVSLANSSVTHEDHL